MGQKTGENTLIWQLDGKGNTIGFNYNNIPYFYMKNLQGDIVGITDASGNIVAKYTYDSWGKLISIKDASDVDKTTDTTFIGYINPLRYRGYYYDSETGLYYLNARYYDPEVGRFISADETLDGGYNLFEYCYNNPINFADYTGLDARLETYMRTNYSGVATVTFVVCTPVPDSRRVAGFSWSELELDVGHVFLRIDDGRGMVRYRGFYPRDVLGPISTLINSDVPGEINNDREHPWNIARVYTITSEMADNIWQYVNSYSGAYNLVHNNCTTFAVETLARFGINVPTYKYWWNLCPAISFVGLLPSLFSNKYGYTPSNAAEDLKASGNYIV